MATLTVYASTANSGLLSSHHATYSTARSGANLTLAAPSAVSGFQADQSRIGGNYFCEEIALDFDASSLPDTAVVSAVAFKMTHWFNAGSPTGTIEVRLYDFGALAAADYVDGASLSAQTLLASLAVSSISAGVQNTFAENGTDFQTSISLTGSTRVLVSTSEIRLGTPTPTAQDIAYWLDPDDATQGNRPQIVITYTVPVTRDVTSAASISVPVVATRDVTGAAAISRDVTRDVMSAAALSVPVARDVTSGAALNAPASRDVTSAASIAYGVQVARDVTSTAVLSAPVASDVTTGAALSATVTRDVSTVAALSAPAFRDMTTVASVSRSADSALRPPAGIGRFEGIPPAGSS